MYTRTPNGRPTAADSRVKRSTCPLVSRQPTGVGVSVGCGVSVGAEKAVGFNVAKGKRLVSVAGSPGWDGGLAGAQADNKIVIRRIEKNRLTRMANL